MKAKGLYCLPKIHCKKQLLYKLFNFFVNTIGI